MKTVNALQNQQEERMAKKNGLQRKGGPPKRQMTDVEGHSDPDIGARLSNQMDASPVTANSLSLYRIPTPLTGWVTLTLEAKDGYEGFGTWHYRFVPQGLVAQFNNPVPDPKEVTFKSIHVGNTHELDPDPNNRVQTFGNHQVKVLQKSIGSATFIIELLRSDLIIKSHWAYDPNKYNDYIANLKEITLTGQKYWVVKELKLAMSVLGFADPVIADNNKNPQV